MATCAARDSAGACCHAHLPFCVPPLSCDKPHFIVSQGNAVGVNPNDPSTATATTPLFTADGRLAPTITVVGEGCTIANEVLVRHSLVLPHKEIKQSHQNEIIL